jgi:alkanesulfonate monooxygenase SsuD/methylene tetrahydromethanopterin reductase-like flavin-dependent oxidoreductase (luciferase family)
MKFDTFFSISQTPADGVHPSEAEMFQNFFQEVVAADKLGYDTAWIAEAHLSSEVQKSHKRPVIPHWQGEVGINTDIFGLAREVFSRTKRIEMGSAISNVLTMGGPIAMAERAANFAMFHGLDPSEKRRLHLGIASGRFEYMNRCFGIVPRTPVEEAAWPALKGLIFWEAAEILARLLNGEILSSDDVRKTTLSRANFRSDEDWLKVQRAADTTADTVAVDNRYHFERLKIIPAEYRRELIQLVAGTHDKAVQIGINQHAPCRVFNLSITQPEIIDATHARMEDAYHPAGGPWKRAYMPRTTFVFINDDPTLSREEKCAAAHARATKALGAYWHALIGTVDPKKVENAAENALIGDPLTVAEQAKARFHPDDRLMLWFDFFDHDVERVIRSMTIFMKKVAPLLEGAP